MREPNCILSLQTLKLPHFYRKITLNTLIHSSLQRSRSFPSAPTLSAKVSNILDTAKLFATFLSRKDKKALNTAIAEGKTLPHPYSVAISMPYVLILN